MTTGTKYLADDASSWLAVPVLAVGVPILLAWSVVVTVIAGCLALAVCVPSMFYVMRGGKHESS